MLTLNSSRHVQQQKPLNPYKSSEWNVVVENDFDGGTRWLSQKASAIK